MVGCDEQRVSEDTENLKKSSVSEEVIQEKIISLPEKIGIAESLIMFNATNAGEPLIYTIGENENGYYYMKYTFQDECYKTNSKMIVQRVFGNNDFLYLVNAIVLDAEKNTYELSLYRYDKEKNKLKKVEFEQLSYVDKDTKAKYDVFDLQFIDDQNFVVVYNSGMFVRYNLLENKCYEYEQHLFGNFCVLNNELYTGDMAKKKVLGFNLDSSCVDEEIQLDLQNNGYNFCTYDEEVYVGCKNGIFSRLMRTGGTMTESEKELYGSSKMIRYVSGIERPIYPIAYVKYKVAIGISASVCSYSNEGRTKLHENLKIKHCIMSEMISQKMTNHSVEYMDCRQSLISAQKGKCSVSGEEFVNAEDVGCCLKKPKELGGKEQYNNMVLVKKKYLPLILEEDIQGLQEKLNAINPDKKHLAKINRLRELRNFDRLG